MRNIALRSSQPAPERFAPNTVTGSVRDQRASRGSTSPLWIAVSAATCLGSMSARNSSTAVPMITSNTVKLDSIQLGCI